MDKELDCFRDSVFFIQKFKGNIFKISGDFQFINKIFENFKVQCEFFSFFTALFYLKTIIFIYDNDKFIGEYYIERI